MTGRPAPPDAEKEPPMKNRPALSYELLSLRRSELMGLALLWVMLFHAYSYHAPWRALALVQEYGYLGVDIFLFLSGLGLCGSLLRRPSVTAFWRARCARILPAYWLVVGAYSLCLIYLGRISFSTMLWSLSGLHYWFQIPGSFNWYVSALLAFYLLAPLWVRLLRKSPSPVLAAVLALPAAYGLYRLAIPLNLLYLRDFLFRIPAFALGTLCGYCLHTGQALSRRHRLLWAGLALAGGALLFGVWTQRIYIAPCFIFSLVVCPLCLLAAWLLERTGLRLRAFSLLGECSLEIYLLNVVVTRETEPLMGLVGLTGHPLRFYLLAYAGNLALGILLHKALEGARRALGRTPEKVPAKG